LDRNPCLLISPFCFLLVVRHPNPTASVYKQKVYDYVDTVVGYQFVNALYRGRRGNLKVDLSLINDVKEQDGGRGEELNLASKKSPAPANVV